MVCSVPSFAVQAVSYCMTIHLLSAVGSPVTPNAPPPALTTLRLLAQEPGQYLLVRTFSSIYAQYNIITFQFRMPEPSEIVSVKS